MKTPTTIRSRTGNHWAAILDHPEGVQVEIWRRQRRSEGVATLMHRTVLDCPWHVACDKVHDIIYNLPDDEDVVFGFKSRR